MQQSTVTFREQEERVNDQLRELITGSSRQVLQIANNSAMGSGFPGGNNQNLSLDLPKLIFLNLGERMYKDGFTNVSSFLSLIALLTM